MSDEQRDPMPEEMKLRLATFMHVRDELGRSHAFGPEDEVPAWARKQITNPKAWGYDVMPVSGPHLDYGRHDDPQAAWLDVICEEGHERQLVARFERLLEAVDIASGEGVAFSWEWTASLAMTKSGSVGMGQSAGRRSYNYTVDDDRPAVFVLEDGRRLLRVQCRECGSSSPNASGDFEGRAWRLFNRFHAVGVSEVSVLALSRSISL